jgi:hypothetical protein
MVAKAEDQEAALSLETSFNDDPRRLTSYGT